MSESCNGKYAMVMLDIVIFDSQRHCDWYVSRETTFAYDCNYVDLKVT